MSSVISTAKAFVSEGALSEIVVKIIDDSVVELLVKLGFFSVPGSERKILSLIAPDPEFKARVFASLRDEGICFAGGADWCPADVFEFLRDQKKLTGFYRKVVWKGAGSPEIIENC